MVPVMFGPLLPRRTFTTPKPSLVSSNAEIQANGIKVGLLKALVFTGSREWRAAWTGAHHEEPESQVQKNRREYRGVHHGVSESASAHARLLLRQMINGRLSQPRGGQRRRSGGGGQRLDVLEETAPKNFHGGSSARKLMTPPPDGNRLILK